MNHGVYSEYKKVIRQHRALRCRRLLLLGLGLLLAPIPGLESRHASFADVGVAQVESLELIRLHDGGELNLVATILLGLGVGGPDEDG